jgi:large subunit ribosomal protein L22
MSKAIVRYVRITPRKVRLISDLVRDKSVNDALTILRFNSRKRTAKIISTLVESAVANADQTGKVNVDNLFVKTIVVNSGPTLKRFTSRAKGQGMKILKRTCHVSVELEER